MAAYCPKCHRPEDIYRSRPRSVFERLFYLLLFMRPVRCGACGHRYHRWIFVPARRREES